MPNARRWKELLLGAMFLALVGCVHTTPGPVGPDGGPGAPGNPAYAVPPPGTVPVELQKIVLPPYVIEAPDQLLIEVIQRSQVPELDQNGVERKGPDGKPILKPVTDRLPVQPISGPFMVRLDGTVGLGYWGAVPVAGLTLEQASEAIRSHLLRHETLKQFGTRLESLTVIIDVLAYNSKRYYVITDGGGFGEQVVAFPITGSETVMDAISNIGGLSDVSSKRNIWVARRTPHPGQPWQILPVDWVGTSQHGITCTNYQLMPGDRVYVKAQRLVKIDRTLARIFSPIERTFGVVLLGTNTINNLVGRGQGFNGNQ
jgi:polysaccharide export outer membrane protein